MLIARFTLASAPHLSWVIVIISSKKDLMSKVGGVSRQTSPSNRLTDWYSVNEALVLVRPCVSRNGLANDIPARLCFLAQFAQIILIPYPLTFRVVQVNQKKKEAPILFHFQDFRVS